jgi:hypothetical protein
MEAGEGPSWGDVTSQVFERGAGRNVINYVVTPQGIYRILGSGEDAVQLIAPLDYLNSE